MYFIGYIIIGLVAGFIAGNIAKSQGLGMLLYLVVGVVGSILGGWLFNLLRIYTMGVWAALFMALMGAVLFLYVMSLITRSCGTKE